MHFSQWKTENPELATQLRNGCSDEQEANALYQRIHAAGIADEHERVTAHLELGEQTGAMTIAAAAVRSGEGVTVGLQKQYIAAAMNRADRSRRQAESDEAGAIVDRASAPANEGAQDMGDRVWALMDAKRKGVGTHG